MDFFQKIFGATFLSAEAEAEQWRIQNKNTDQKIIVVLITSTICLALSKYLSDPFYLYQLLGTHTAGNTDPRLMELGWWALVLFFFYFIVPALVIKIYLREKLSGYGLRIKGAFKDYYLYIIMLLVMVPLVLFFSRTASFQARY